MSTNRPAIVFGLRCRCGGRGAGDTGVGSIVAPSPTTTEVPLGVSAWPPSVVKRSRQESKSSARAAVQEKSVAP